MNWFFFFSMVLLCLLAGCSFLEKLSFGISDFFELLFFLFKGGGFKMDDYWIWGGLVIKGLDGQYYFFVFCWLKQYLFNQGYVYYFLVVYVVSENLEGFYCFKDVVLF